ncbi:hypothetical protein SAMN05421824_2874 [Hyunsoonleella jejuensis]|uniref:DUF4157 domain-containing protein n=1 Tax=Hyunsoonleella jejuensis TaxID=419940 RepID=A0A1H9KYR2_9FLAO|nr:hypothetical protein [Hyunsoonleella jejuensis]SER04322.1 hypothetical protein SAMN05421824_2874 [Hyunsoonleella jejuensis]
MILVVKYLVPKGYMGISIFPFIFLSTAASKSSRVLINHEKIHLKQQLELLVLPFYIWYMLEFLIRFAYYQNWERAYRNISFEREAYDKEHDLSYLSRRKFWSFLNYL